MNPIRLSFSAAIVMSVGIIWWGAGQSRGENWPQWRGARLDGVSGETGLPTKWSKEENVAWRLPLPGPAGATPVIWDNRIFLTSVAGEELVLICADTAGKELWKQVIAKGNRNVRGDEGNYASPSPCTDGKHVWTQMGTGDLACFDFAGNEVWKLNLQERYGPFKIQFGYACTPVLDAGRLYIQMIHTNSAHVVALNAATGEEIWKQNRPSDARAECEHSYASPMMYRDAKQSYLLTHGADYVVAHRLNDGGEIWRCGGLNSKAKYNNTLRFIASPVAVPGLIVVPSAKNGPVLGLSPDAQGDVTGTESAHLWTRPSNTPDVPSPLVHDGLVYLCRENGVLICLDAKTGEQVYEQSLHRDRHRASPVYVDGKVICSARDGTVSVVKAGRQFELLATNTMTESISSSPVISGGTLYLRTFDALYAIRGK